MSHSLTVAQLRRILENAVAKRYGMSLDDYITLMRNGSAPDDKNLQYFVRRLPGVAESLTND